MLSCVASLSPSWGTSRAHHSGARGGGRIGGPAQNSQSWPTVPGTSEKKATAVERAGLTEVLVTGIETRWISVSASPMEIPAKRGSGRRGRAEDDEDEARGQHQLDEEGGEQAVAAGRVGAVAVRGEAAGDEVGLARGDQVEHHRGGMSPPTSWAIQ